MFTKAYHVGHNNGAQPMLRAQGVLSPAREGLGPAFPVHLYWVSCTDKGGLTLASVEPGTGAPYLTLRYFPLN